MRRAGTVAVTVGALLASACAYQVADLALATTAEGLVPFEVLAPGLEVEDCTMESAMGYHDESLTVFRHPTVESLVARALSRAPTANAIANLSVETSEYFILIGRLTCVRLRGDAVRVGGE